MVPSTSSVVIGDRTLMYTLWNLVTVYTWYEQTFCQQKMFRSENHSNIPVCRQHGVAMTTDAHTGNGSDLVCSGCQMINRNGFRELVNVCQCWVSAFPFFFASTLFHLLRTVCLLCLNFCYDSCTQTACGLLPYCGKRDVLPVPCSTSSLISGHVWWVVGAGTKHPGIFAGSVCLVRGDPHSASNWVSVPLNREMPETAFIGELKSWVVCVCGCFLYFVDTFNCQSVMWSKMWGGKWNGN